MDEDFLTPSPQTRRAMSLPAEQKSGMLEDVSPEMIYWESRAKVSPTGDSHGRLSAPDPVPAEAKCHAATVERCNS